ncbi:hypothetical protein PMAYCL1PPCAC_24636, partial [Pristionchus mayeri]
MITSVVSFIFKFVYQINEFLATNFEIRFCVTTRYFFLGWSSINAFWCLILFSPMVRKAAF